VTEKTRANSIALAGIIIAILTLGAAGIGAWSDMQSDHAALDVRVTALEETKADLTGSIEKLTDDIGRLSIGLAKIETLVALLVTRDGLGNGHR